MEEMSVQGARQLAPAAQLARPPRRPPRTCPSWQLRRRQNARDGARVQVEPEPDSPREGTRAARLERRHSNPYSRLGVPEVEPQALGRSQSGLGPGPWAGIREGRPLEQDAGTAGSVRSRRERRFALTSPPPTVSRSAAESVQNTLRNNTLLSPFVGGTPSVGPPPLLHADSMESGLDETVRQEEMFRWFQETAYRQADAQALHTVIYLSAAAILWSLLYFNYLLVSVYFTPVTWAVLSSIPLRRWQDKIMKSIETESSVRFITFKVLMGVSTGVLADVLTDTLTGNLSLVLVIWVIGSRVVDSLGWVPAVLSSAILLLMALCLYFAVRFMAEFLAPLLSTRLSRIVMPLSWPLELASEALEVEQRVRIPLRKWMQVRVNRRKITALVLLAVTVVVCVAIGALSLIYNVFSYCRMCSLI